MEVGTDPEKSDWVSTSKVRERLDIEQWFFEQLLEMTKVQSVGDLRIYENMINTLILRLSAHWPEGFEKKWNGVRTMFSLDPMNQVNRERLEQKEVLLAELMDKIGIGFTRTKKIEMKKGMEPLWKLFPPNPPNENKNGQKS